MGTAVGWVWVGVAARGVDDLRYQHEQASSPMITKCICNRAWKGVVRTHEACLEEEATATLVDRPAAPIKLLQIDEPNISDLSSC